VNVCKLPAAFLLTCSGKTMQKPKLITCAKCKNTWTQFVRIVPPDVAEKLKANPSDHGIVFTCPQCQYRFMITIGHLPDLPDALQDR